MLYPANLLNLFTSYNNSQLTAPGCLACSGVTLTRGRKRGWQGKTWGWIWGLWVTSSGHAAGPCPSQMGSSGEQGVAPPLMILHPGPRDAHVHACQLCPQRNLGLQAHPWPRGISAHLYLSSPVIGPTASYLLSLPPSLLVLPQDSPATGRPPPVLQGHPGPCSTHGQHYVLNKCSSLWMYRQRRVYAWAVEDG